MKKALFITLVSISILSSCKKESQIEVFGIKTKKEYNQLKKASWFIGNWENASKEATFKEIWLQKNDSSYSGESFVTVEKDTVFYEKIDLIQKNDSLFYVVSVKNQNAEKPVSFYLTKSGDNELVFENQSTIFRLKLFILKLQMTV